MKTIQEHLREADRKRLLDCLAYRFLSDPIRLLEAREYTVQEIMEGYSRHMNSFIETLLGTEYLHQNRNHGPRHHDTV